LHQKCFQTISHRKYIAAVKEETQTLYLEDKKTRLEKNQIVLFLITASK